MSRTLLFSGIILVNLQLKIRFLLPAVQRTFILWKTMQPVSKDSSWPESGTREPWKPGLSTPIGTLLTTEWTLTARYFIFITRGPTSRKTAH